MHNRSLRYGKPDHNEYLLVVVVSALLEDSGSNDLLDRNGVRVQLSLLGVAR